MEVLHLVRTSATRDAVRDNLALLAAEAGALHRVTLPAALVDADLAEGPKSVRLECLVWIADAGRRWPARWATCRRVEHDRGFVTLHLTLGGFAPESADEVPAILPAQEGRPLLAYVSDLPPAIRPPSPSPDEPGWRAAVIRCAQSPAYRDAAFFRVTRVGPAPGQLTLEFENRHLAESRKLSGLAAQWTAIDGLPREDARALPSAGEDIWSLSPPPAPGTQIRLYVEPERARSTQVEITALLPITSGSGPETADRVAEPEGEYIHESSPLDVALWACWQFLEARLAESQPPAFFIEALRHHFLPMAPDLPGLWERLAVWLAAAGQWEAAYRQLRSLPAAHLSGESRRIYLLAASQLRAEAPYEQLLSDLDFDTEERRQELAEALRCLAPGRAVVLLRQLVEQILQPADALAVLESLAGEVAPPALALPMAGWLTGLAGPERAYRYLLAQHEASDLARRDPRVLMRLVELAAELENPPGVADILRLAVARAGPEEMPALLTLGRRLLTGETLTRWLADAAVALGTREATRSLAAALWLDIARARRLAGEPELAAVALHRAWGLSPEEGNLQVVLDQERARIARDLQRLAPLRALVEARRQDLAHRLGGRRSAGEILPRRPGHGPTTLLGDLHARRLLEQLCGFSAAQSLQAVAEAAPPGEAWGLFLAPPGEAELEGWVRTPGLQEGARFAVRTRRGAARLLFEYFQGYLPLESILEEEWPPTPSSPPQIE
ncbi:MAG: hypothetical protein HY320_12930 [Armatimonadetes bacterium]|nr:hypothetical protein [Armatimonadota bacterium]